jgi:signal transduction histidine kinase
VQHAALRIIQEALSNAYRHGGARHVRVGVSVEDRALTVTIADDGRGLTSAHGEPALGVGIPGMRARAEQLSGRLEITSDRSGARVTAILPLGTPRWGR